MTINSGLIINFLIACLFIGILWLVLTNVPPVAQYRTWINLGCLILILLALIAVLMGKRAIDIGSLDPHPHDLRLVAGMPLHEGQPLVRQLLL